MKSFSHLTAATTVNEFIENNIVFGYFIRLHFLFSHMEAEHYLQVTGRAAMQNIATSSRASA